MKGFGVFLKKYAWHSVLPAMLTIVLLRLTGADAAALAQSCGQWSVVPSPSVGSGINVLYGVTAISPNDVWAVGTSANATLTEHWNGSQWSVVPNPNSSTSMYAVTAISTNDVWAVGYTLFHDSRRALIEHWNGTSWSMVPNPPPPNACLPAFGGVTAISSNDVWAVGSEWGNCYDSPPYSLTEHWNGTRWSNIPNPTLPFSYLYGVTATSAGDFWTVGSYSPPNSNAQTVIEFYC